MLICVKPALRSRFSTSSAALRDGARRGAGAARLGCDGHAPAGCEPAAQVGEPLGRRGPEPEGVDGEDGVEGAVESGRKLIGRGIDQGDPARPDGGGVAPGRLPEHHAGMVDAVHVTCAGAEPVPRPRGRGRSRSRGPGRRAAHRAARPPSRCAAGWTGAGCSLRPRLKISADPLLIDKIRDGEA